MKFRRHQYPEAVAGEQAIDPWLAILTHAPFIPYEQVPKHYGPKDIERDVRVDLGRVVSSSLGRDSWIPEGMKSLHDGTIISSTEHVKNLARARGYNGGSDDPIRLRSFYDSEGAELYAVDAGRHRVAAAKLNQEPNIVADIARPREV